MASTILMKADIFLPHRINSVVKIRLSINMIYNLISQSENNLFSSMTPRLKNQLVIAVNLRNIEFSTSGQTVDFQITIITYLGIYVFSTNSVGQVSSPVKCWFSLC